MQNRFGRTGSPDDLDDAVTAGRDAVAATPPGHPSRATVRSNLGKRWAGGPDASRGAKAWCGNA